MVLNVASRVDLERCATSVPSSFQGTIGTANPAGIACTGAQCIAYVQGCSRGIVSHTELNHNNCIQFPVENYCGIRKRGVALCDYIQQVEFRCRMWAVAAGYGNIGSPHTLPDKHIPQRPKTSAETASGRTK